MRDGRKAIKDDFCRNNNTISTERRRRTLELIVRIRTIIMILISIFLSNLSVSRVDKFLGRNRFTIEVVTLDDQFLRELPSTLWPMFCGIIIRKVIYYATYIMYFN